MKNPLHSLLYREYKKQVIEINALQIEIGSYKNYLIIRGNYFKPHSVIGLLKQTRKKLKHPQSIARYLKEEIRYQNNITPKKMIQYYNDHAFPKSISITLTPTKNKRKMKYIILILYNLILIYHHQNEFILIFLALSSFLTGLGILADDPILQNDPPNKNKFKKFLISISLIHTALFIINLINPY